jgi:hypothetical protein
MAELAIFFKSFIREYPLFMNVKSIQNNLKDVTWRLYIADDSPEITHKKQLFYDSLEKQGHKVLILPFNTGASKSRNLMLDALENESFILRMDDDHEILPETNIRSMITLLESIDHLGGCVGLERQFGWGKGVFPGMIGVQQGFMKYRDGVLEKDLDHPKKFTYKEVNGIRYTELTYTRNMILLKRNVFNYIKWDSRLKFAGEHEDFLLEFMCNTPYKMALTIDSTHGHHEDLPYEESMTSYRINRAANSSHRDLFNEKWQIKKFTIIRPFFRFIRDGFFAVVNRLGKKFLPTVETLNFPGCYKRSKG